MLGFLEKPDPAEIDTDEVNAGAYVLERSVIDLIPAGRAVSIEREVFPRLVGQGLFGRRLEGYWMDIGTLERYLQASWDILEGAVETDVTATGPGIFVDAGAEVDARRRSGRARSSRPDRGSARARSPEAVVLENCRVDAEAGCRGRSWRAM